MSWTQVAYRYDGSFAGFLTCVYEAYVNREAPIDFRPDACPLCSLYPERTVVTHQSHAKRVFRSFKEKFGGPGQNMVSRGFLTCLEDKELWLWRFIQLGYEQGPSVTKHLADPTVDRVRRAVQHLNNEAHLLTGFVRFSDVGGVLAGEITPKNRVLPLLRPHFCGRLSTESFILYDHTHREALFAQPGRWAILPVDDFHLGPPSGEERAFREMWRAFYKTVSIEGRYNPKCRQTHMPKRYWGNMTEFQTDLPGDMLPPAK